MKIALRVCLCTISLAVALPAAAQGRARPNHDNFYWLGEFNKASTVMVVEQGIVPAPLGGKIAEGVARVIEDGEKPGARRPGDYLQYEPLVIAYAGPDATRMHSGRSRQDILATTRRAQLRERLLDCMDAMNAARGKLLSGGPILDDDPPESLANEVWLPVEGYENLYAVSNHGRVRRLKSSDRRWRTPEFAECPRVSFKATTGITMAT